MLENKRSVTSRQLIILLEELERDPTLSHERILSASSSRRIHEAKWEQLVTRLNAVPNGAKRSVPRWKTVLTNWKLSLKRQASNENAGCQAVVDEMGSRLLRLVEEEELFQDIDGNMFPDFTESLLDDENHDLWNGPQQRAASRRSRLARAGAGHEPLMARERRASNLRTIYDNNVDRDGSPGRKIMQMQLDRLHSVSQQLESHIQDVQNRIQNIKDMWQHECIEE